MFERFTHRARRVVVLAQEESRLLGHNHIGTEHILLGLVREGDGVAAIALQRLGIELELVRKRVEEIIGRGEGVPSMAHIPFTPRAKKVLELSLREALGLGHNYIGTEHILLGVVREGEGVAAQVLVEVGATLDRVRHQVTQLLSGGARDLPHAPPEEGLGERAAGTGPRCPSCRTWLGETGHPVSRRVMVDDAEGGEARPVVFVYCGRCGVTLSASPEASAGPD
jgi:ATP-dependent Clp protease ATP-binding subunit ClpC